MAVIKDIARIIAAKHQIRQADAEHFVQMMVEVIDEGLLRDRQVKIKGFGTFKLQSVKERTSVNVNTGERVIIGEHDKVTFTPDNVMRDIVNKPFAQFETVIVDDNSPLLDGTIELDDELEENASDEPVVETAKEIVEPKEQEVVETEPVSDTDTAAPEQQIEADATEEAPEEMDNEPVAVVEKEVTEEVPEVNTEPQVEETVADVEEETQEEESVEVETAEYIDEEECDDCNQQYPRCRNIFIYYGILINIIIVILAFGLGYFASKHNWFGWEESTHTTQIVKQDVTPNKPDTLAVSKVVKNDEAAKPDTVKAESRQEVPSEKVQPKAEPVQPKTEPAQIKQEQEPKPLKGFDDDPRVRTGAYYIMGTDQVVTVKEGQTLLSISKSYLGPDMECYVEAYNNIKSVKPGDKVKIPKLLLKKRLKK